MRKLKKIALFILAGAVFVTCKKEQLPPNATIGQPVFSFTGSINSSNVNWQAGVNGYYMYTSYSQDANNVYNFIGTLKNNAGNDNSIQIIIKDYKVSAKNGSAVIDTSLIPAYYSFNKPGGNTTAYKVTFNPILDGNVASSSSWSFGDGGVSAKDTPVHEYMHPGDYNTSLAVVYTSCNPDLSNIIKFGTPDAGLYTSLIGVQDDTLNPTTALIFTGICSGSPTTFNWKFGDGKDTTTSSSTVAHNYPGPGMYTITLTTTDSAGYTAVYNENIVTSGYPESCEVNYYESITPQANPDSLSNVTIVYTSGNGTVYNSNNSLQPTGSYFKITSVSPYQNNTSNQATKMLNVTFSCLLYPATGSPIPASGTAVIAVAYY